MITDTIHLVKEEASLAAGKIKISTPQRQALHEGESPQPYRQNPRKPTTQMQPSCIHVLRGSNVQL